MGPGTIRKELIRALEDLAVSAEFREVLAENLYWASCEGFLQSSWLAAFNRRGGGPAGHGFVADRERELAKGRRPDLSILARTSHDDWWAARGEKAAGRALDRLCLAAVELKVAWTEGNATGSAVISQKAKEVAKDAVKLGELTGSPREKYLAVLVAGFHEEGVGEVEVDNAFETIRTAVELLERPPPVVLLHEHVSSHWAGLAKQVEPRYLATAHLRLWRVG